MAGQVVKLNMLAAGAPQGPRAFAAQTGPLARPPATPPPGPSPSEEVAGASGEPPRSTAPSGGAPAAAALGLVWAATRIGGGDTTGQRRRRRQRRANGHSRVGGGDAAIAANLPAILVACARAAPAAATAAATSSTPPRWRPVRHQSPQPDSAAQFPPPSLPLSLKGEAKAANAAGTDSADVGARDEVVAAGHGGHGIVEVVDAGDGRGKGLRTTAAAAKGAVLLEEAPLYVERGDLLKPEESFEAVNELSPEARAQLLDLAGTEGGALDEVGYAGERLAVLRVLRTNGVALPGGGRALYAVACRANHSCRPNVALCAGETGVIRLVAIRPVAAGEEVLVSYLGESELLRPTERRQQLLSKSWGFVCGCARCSAEVDDTRGFACPACAVGTVHGRHAAHGGGWSACSACGQKPNAEAADALDRAEEEWLRNVQAVRDNANSPLAGHMVVAVFDGLVSGSNDGWAASVAPLPDAHWISARLASQAAEALLKRGDGEAAVRAASLRRSFARTVLGGAASRASAEAAGMHASAAALAGDAERAARLYGEALAEAKLLPPTATGALIAELGRRRRRELGDPVGQEASDAAASSQAH